MAIFLSDIVFKENEQIINLTKLVVVLARVITMAIIYGFTNFLYYTNLKMGEFAYMHKRKNKSLWDTLIK